MQPSPADGACTLEGRVMQRLEACDTDDDKVRYILETMPFIKEYASIQTVEQSDKSGLLDEFVQVTHISKRNSVLKRYLYSVEKKVDDATFAAVKEHDRGATRHNDAEAEYYCDQCDAGMEFHARESMLVCTSCGVCKTYMEMNKNNLTYEQQISLPKNTSFSYQRINHLCENLNSFHAKVSRLTHPPKKIMCGESITTMRVSAPLWVVLIVLFVLLAGLGTSLYFLFRYREVEKRVFRLADYTREVNGIKITSEQFNRLPVEVRKVLTEQGIY